MISAITVYQPYASLVAIGCKFWEFRPWFPPVDLIQNRIAIHASKRKIVRAEVQELLIGLRGGYLGNGITVARIAECIEFLEQILISPGSLPRQSIVCTARLGQPMRDKELAGALRVPWETFKPPEGEHTNWGWPLSGIEQIAPSPEPIPGQRGFWRYSGSLEAL